MAKRAKGGPEAAGAPARDGRRGWRIAFLVLCTIGLCMAADLQRMHVNVHTDPDYRSYCAVSERVNCDTVAASRWAVFAGLPVATWALLGYLGMGALCVWGLRNGAPPRSWPFGILFWAAAFCVLVSAGLFYVSHFQIRSVCPVCAVLYAVNLALLGAALRELRRVGTSPAGALSAELASLSKRSGGVLAFGVVGAVSVGALWGALPRYWTIEISAGPGGLTVGRTADGHPWIGASRPTVEILEYSDYQCPHCYRGHQEMRELVAERPDELRLVHRHYPLDHACNPTVPQLFHPYACEYSRLAYCAGVQGRFWEANDFLYLHGRRAEKVTPQELAAAIGVDAARLGSCALSDEAVAAIGADLRAGQQDGVRGTPTFVLEGRTYPGRIPEEDVLEALGPRAE